MNIPLFLVALFFMLATAAVCFAGIILMASGTEANKKYGTKLMAARVYLQAISLVMVAIAFSF